MLNGPMPAEVTAAIMQMYEVKGVRVLILSMVVLDINWKVCPVPTTVTLMM